MILNTIIEPIVIRDKSGLWLWTPLSHPTTEWDVDFLSKVLEEKLKKFNAKEYGIC